MQFCPSELSSSHTTEFNSMTFPQPFDAKPYSNKALNHDTLTAVD